MSIIVKFTHTNRRDVLRWIELIYSYTLAVIHYSFHGVTASDGKKNYRRSSLIIINHHLYPHHHQFF